MNIEDWLLDNLLYRPSHDMRTALTAAEECYKELMRDFPELLPKAMKFCALYTLSNEAAWEFMFLAQRK